MPEVGVITEQGDLGLGFDPLNPQDSKKVLQEQQSEKNKKDEDEK